MSIVTVENLLILKIYISINLYKYGFMHCEVFEATHAMKRGRLSEN